MSFATNPYSASDSSLRSEFNFTFKALRAGRQYYWVGIVGIFVHSALGICLVAMCLYDRSRPVSNPVPFIIVVGTVFAFFITLSAYLLSFYFKYRLCVDDVSVIQVGVFTIKSLRVEDIQSIIWRNRPVGGSVVIKSDSQKFRIEFGAIDRSKVNGLIDKLRQLVPADKQVGWVKFKHKRIPDAG